MNNKLYKLMNWPEIEAVVYSESDRPHDILGAHHGGHGTLLQTFQPGATAVMAVVKDLDDPYKLATYKMEMADEAGFFACLIPAKKIEHYSLKVTMPDNSEKEMEDAYAFYPDFLSEDDMGKWNAGIHYRIHDKLGAHPRSVKAVAGMNFAVWAPEALRVSVVGDFNNWDGRSHQMHRRAKSGIFEIFIPAVKPGDLYKFELKVKGGFTCLKTDPFAFGQQLRPDTASIACDIRKFAWDDAEWMAIRPSRQAPQAPINVYELYLGSFKQDTAEKEDKNENKNMRYLNYRELAPLVINHVKKMRYTHVELMPIMEHYEDASRGYQTFAYYAPTARHGGADDFMFFVNEMHKAGIGVILDWVPAYFAENDFALPQFDGSCLFEHLDSRQGRHPHNGCLLFNYGRPEVSNFLMANALYWVEKYHVDGLKIGELGDMLYLDYGKGDGEWIANIYGGRENLEAIEFLKHLNAIMKKRNKGVLMIAEEDGAWPRLTDEIKDGGMGFSLKFNNGWVNDYLRYIELDPFFRAHHHPELTFSMIYAYSERFMLAFSHREVTNGKSGMIGKMPGHVKDKFANLRLSYAYQIMHPGKKLLFMGQDMAEFRDFDEKRELQWSLLEHEEHLKLNTLVCELNDFYRANPALYALDDHPDGFAWINCISAEKCMLSFMRMSKKEEERLIIVANFANVGQHFTIGVPCEGKYRELINTDDVRFGGTGQTNKRMIATQDEAADDFPYSFTMNAAPLSLSVFNCQPFSEKELKTRRGKQEELIKKRLSAEISAAEEKVHQEIRDMEDEVAKSKAAAKQRVMDEIAAAEEKAAKELSRLFANDKGKAKGGGSGAFGEPFRAAKDSKAKKQLPLK